MEIIYCTTPVDPEDLRRQPTAYASSKIRGGSLQSPHPFYPKEFMSVKNIRYVELPRPPRLARLWTDMMSKRTFSYNFEHLNSRLLFEEYEKYNAEIAAQIGASDESLVVINDASLYLLPSLVRCRVAVRNIRFDSSFIERVPYYEKILAALFRAQKFFASRSSLSAFKDYVNADYRFWNTDHGGCFYMKAPVDKERVRWVVQACCEVRNRRKMLPECRCAANDKKSGGSTRCSTTGSLSSNASEYGTESASECSKAECRTAANAEDSGLSGAASEQPRSDTTSHSSANNSEMSSSVARSETSSQRPKNSSTLAKSLNSLNLQASILGSKGSSQSNLRSAAKPTDSSTDGSLSASVPADSASSTASTSSTASSYSSSSSSRSRCSGSTTCACPLSREHAERLRDKVRRFIASRPRRPSLTVLTNVPLLHLEDFIRCSSTRPSSATVIRYLRDTVEVDKEQELMLQYFRKTYDCEIETVDTYDFEEIVLEMLHCDVFVGGRYYELAKMLRRPIVHDSFDPRQLRKDIEAAAGKLCPRQSVQGEIEYLREFLEVNGCILAPNDATSQHGDDEKTLGGTEGKSAAHSVALADDSEEVDEDSVVDAMVVDYVTERKSSRPRSINNRRQRLCYVCERRIESENNSSESISSETNGAALSGSEKGVSVASANASASASARKSVAAACPDSSMASSLPSSCEAGQSISTMPGVPRGCKCDPPCGSPLYERVIDNRRVLFRRVGTLACQCKKVVNDKKNDERAADDEDDQKTVRSEEAESGDKNAGASTSQCSASSSLRRGCCGGSRQTEADDETNCYCHSGKSCSGLRGSADGRSGGTAAAKHSKESEAVSPADTGKIRSVWEESGRVALLDYDGTLTELVSDPKQAAPSAEIIELLLRLSEKGRVVICTGRACSEADEWFPPEIEIYAEHGAFHRVGGRWSGTESAVPGLEECAEVMKFYGERTPGSVIEEKRSGCAFHFRNVPGFDFTHLFYLLRRIVGDAVYVGKSVIEVRSGSKDSVCREVRPAICAGDDVTDEDMFRYCEGVAIKVGAGPTVADCSVGGVAEMVALLEGLLRE